MDLSKLSKGDTILVQTAQGERIQRTVVRVVDLDGVLGGLVDTKPVHGRYSRSSGFVAGNSIVNVIR